MIDHGRKLIDAHIQEVRLMRGNLAEAGGGDVPADGVLRLVERAEHMADEIERLRELIDDQAHYLDRHPGNAKAVARKLLAALGKSQ